ncbi:MAG: molybdopterin converting factor subunit 1 [Chthoniobacterales bacterium]
MKTITVLYFAVLREQSGAPQEEIHTRAATVGDLYHELRTQHHFTLESANLRIACNEDFVPLDHVFTSGDTLALMPPMSGG